MKQSLVDAGLSLYSVDAAAVDLSRTKGKGQGKGSKAARAGMLFTHRGFSGPAVLDLSHHAVMALERSKPKPGAPCPHQIQNPKPKLPTLCWAAHAIILWVGAQGDAPGVFCLFCIVYKSLKKQV